MNYFVLASKIPTQKEVIDHIKEELLHSDNYFSTYQPEILRALLGTALSVCLYFLFTTLFHRLLNRYFRPSNNWKKQMTEALYPAFGVLLTAVAILLFSLPLIRTFEETAAALIVKLFYTFFSLTAAWGLLRSVNVIDGNIRHLAEKRDNALDNLTVGIIGSVLKAVIILTVFLFIGQNIFDINISALLASAGVIGLAFALAAKDTVSNFFGTLVIVADAPFRIGDRIECDSVCGIVSEVGMRSSRIITDDGTRCTVPNSLLTNAAVFQRNRKGHLKRVIDLTLVYETTAEQMVQAIDILHHIMDDFHGPDHPDFRPRIYFSSLGSYSLNIRAILFFKTESFEEEEKLVNELNFLILKNFNEAGLKFAYPTQMLYISQSP